jgi:hypothetical protein
VGESYSLDFPNTAGGPQESTSLYYPYYDYPHTDLFVARLSEDLTTLLQATYLGGSDFDGRYPDIAVHPTSGEVYVSGATWSSDFPGTDGGAQPTFAGSGSHNYANDAFVVRLSADLTELLQATYLGGTDSDIGSTPSHASENPCLAIHPGSGDVYVAGVTASSDFPGTAEGAQSDMIGQEDIFVARLTADLETLIQATFFGGSAYDRLWALAIHPGSGDIYIGGRAQSEDLPATSGSLQETLHPGSDRDAFVACLSEDLKAHLGATYLGGSNANDYVVSLAVHPDSGDVYAAGYTRSEDFPGTAGGAQETHNQYAEPDPVAFNGFLACMSPDLTTLRQATYLGTTETQIFDLAIHPASGEVYVTGIWDGNVGGRIGERHFPGAEGGVQAGHCYGPDVFVSKLSADLETLHQSTFLGGTADEIGWGLGFHPYDGDVYVTGMTRSWDFPMTPGAPQYEIPGEYSSFVARMTADLQGEPNEPPEITSDPVTEAFDEQGYSYQVIASDPNRADCLLYYLDEGPDGMGIARQTGLVGWDPDFYDAGDHQVLVTVEDSAGIGTSQSFVVTVYVTPIITSISLPAANPGTTYSYYVSARDNNEGEVLTFSLDTAPSGMTIERNTDTSARITWEPTEADLGEHDVIVRVTDPVGLFSTREYVLIVKPPNLPPTITSEPVTVAFVGQPYTYDVEATDPNPGDTLRFRLVGEPSGMTIDEATGLIEWTPTPGQTGPEGVTVVVEDDDGLRDTQYISITVTEVNPPVITSSPVTTAVQDQPYTYDVEAEDPDEGDVLTFHLDTAPSGMTIDAQTGLINWIPTAAQVGEQDVAVRVEDQLGLSTSQSFQITVASSNHPPVITSMPLVTATPGIPYHYDVQAEDPDAGDVVTFSLDVQPTGMEIEPSTGVIGWTPSADQSESHDVTVRATDGGGLSDTQSFTVVVTNNPPSITSVPVTHAMEYTPYVYPVVATDPDVSDVLTYSLVIAPDGMTISAATGLIQWTPEVWETGDAPVVRDHDVTVSVVDVGGLSDSQSFTITVEASPPRVRVEGSPETLNVPVGASDSISYVVTFETSTTGAYTIGYTQSVSPDDNGLSLELDPPAGWSADTSSSWLTQQVVSGNTAGTYEITTTATVNETGATGQVTTTVHVDGSVPVVHPTGSYPDAIAIGEPTDVLFTSKLSSLPALPTEVLLEEVDASGDPVRELGELVDDGSSGDLMAHDHVYSGTFNVSSGSEGALYFRTKATFPDLPDPVYAESCRVYVTRFPIGVALPDMSKIVSEPVTGVDLLSNRVLVSFVDGTEPDTIETIVTNVGGTIVGTIFRIGTYQVEITDTGDLEGLETAVNALKASPLVESVEPVAILYAAGFSPDDPYYETEQFVLRDIRADEAWVVARGWPVVAVIDSGVDYTHPDLAGRVTVASFLQEGQADDPGNTLDNTGHGTQVAGILAAAGDNGIGIAGMSWQGYLLSIKATALEGVPIPMRVPTTTTMVGSAIVHAVDMGVKIVNLSNGFYLFLQSEDVPEILEQLDDARASLRMAVEYARANGSLVFAAAGNDNSGYLGYPQMFPGTINVGATESGPGGEVRRWYVNGTGGRPFGLGVGSNYGTYVDIAAPGRKVYSTWPTYEVPGYDLDEACPQPMRDIEGCYRHGDGTSFATPMVAGAAALVWSRFPELKPDQVWKRLEQTAVPLPGEELGAGSLDVFEAVFNGSFEADEIIPATLRNAELNWGNAPVGFYDIPGIDYDANELYMRPNYKADFPFNEDIGWYFFGYESNYNTGMWDAVLYGQGGGFIRALGPLRPTHGDRMAFIWTSRVGETWDFIHDPEQVWYSSYYFTFMEQSFYIEPGQTEIVIAVDYDLITEEPPGWDNDGFQISLEWGGSDPLAERVHVIAHGTNGLATTPLEASVPLSEGWGLRHTGWQTAMVWIPLPESVTEWGRWAFLRFAIYDQSLGVTGSNAYDSLLLIDHVRFE